MDKRMSRTYALKMLHEIIKTDLEKEITFSDLKTIADNCTYETGDAEIESYLKSEIICNLFEKLPYYNIEDYAVTLSVRLIRIASSCDGYNVLSRMLSATLREIFVDINRREEIELFYHILLLAEMYYRNYELYNQESRELILKNLCETKKISSLDVAENYSYKQMVLPWINNESKSARDEISKTNYNRKENIKKRLKKFIISNFSEKTFGELVDSIYSSIDESATTIFDQTEIKDLYTKVFEDLYTEAVYTWYKIEDDKEYKQLSIFNQID